MKKIAMTLKRIEVTSRNDRLWFCGSTKFGSIPGGGLNAGTLDNALSSSGVRLDTRAAAIMVEILLYSSLINVQVAMSYYPAESRRKHR